MLDLVKEYFIKEKSYSPIIIKTVNILWIILSLIIGESVLAVLVAIETINIWFWYAYKRKGVIKERKEYIKNKKGEI